jgi:hypothetical protein
LKRLAKGLLYGPSRKQYDWQSPRTGTFITPERHESVAKSVVYASNNVTETFTHITVPAGSKASLTSLKMKRIGTGSRDVRVYIDGNLAFLFDENTTVDYEFRFEEAIRFQISLTLLSVGSGTFAEYFSVSTVHILESQSEGYLNS